MSTTDRWQAAIVEKGTLPKGFGAACSTVPGSSGNTRRTVTFFCEALSMAENV